MADSPEKENTKCSGRTVVVVLTVWQTYTRRNKVNHCVADPQMKKIKATNSSESCGCVTVHENKSFIL